MSGTKDPSTFRFKILDDGVYKKDKFEWDTITGILSSVPLDKTDEEAELLVIDALTDNGWTDLKLKNRLPPDAKDIVKAIHEEKTDDEKDKGNEDLTPTPTKPSNTHGYIYLEFDWDRMLKENHDMYEDAKFWTDVMPFGDPQELIDKVSGLEAYYNPTGSAHTSVPTSNITSIQESPFSDQDLDRNDEEDEGLQWPTDVDDVVQKSVPFYPPKDTFMPSDIYGSIDWAAFQENDKEARESAEYWIDTIDDITLEELIEKVPEVAKYTYQNILAQGFQNQSIDRQQEEPEYPEYPVYVPTSYATPSPKIVKSRTCANSNLLKSIGKKLLHELFISTDILSRHDHGSIWDKREKDADIISQLRFLAVCWGEMFEGKDASFQEIDEQSTSLDLFALARCLVTLVSAQPHSRHHYLVKNNEVSETLNMTPALAPFLNKMWRFAPKCIIDSYGSRNVMLEKKEIEQLLTSDSVWEDYLLYAATLIYFVDVCQGIRELGNRKSDSKALAGIYSLFVDDVTAERDFEIMRKLVNPSNNSTISSGLRVLSDLWERVTRSHEDLLDKWTPATEAFSYVKGYKGRRSGDLSLRFYAHTKQSLSLYWNSIKFAFESLDKIFLKTVDEINEALLRSLNNAALETTSDKGRKNALAWMEAQSISPLATKAFAIYLWTVYKTKSKEISSSGKVSVSDVVIKRIVQSSNTHPQKSDVETLLSNVSDMAISEANVEDFLYKELTSNMASCNSMLLYVNIAVENLAESQRDLIRFSLLDRLKKAFEKSFDSSEKMGPSILEITKLLYKAETEGTVSLKYNEYLAVLDDIKENIGSISDVINVGKTFPEWNDIRGMMSAALEKVCKEKSVERDDITLEDVENLLYHYVPTHSLESFSSEKSSTFRLFKGETPDVVLVATPTALPKEEKEEKKEESEKEDEETSSSKFQSSPVEIKEEPSKACHITQPRVEISQAKVETTERKSSFHRPPRKNIDFLSGFNQVSI